MSSGSEFSEPFFSMLMLLFGLNLKNLSLLAPKKNNNINFKYIAKLDDNMAQIIFWEEQGLFAPSLYVTF